jgi:hypothetical protein
VNTQLLGHITPQHSTQEAALLIELYGIKVNISNITGMDSARDSASLILIPSGFCVAERFVTTILDDLRDGSASKV